MENWMPITGTKGFIEVSNYGRVRSTLRGKPHILKAQPDKKGYLRVRVTIEREKKTYKIHREVAKAFVPNPHNFPQVNHKDGDKSNNNCSNLEWVTNKENAHHAIANGLWHNVYASTRKENESRKKPIIGYFAAENGVCSKCFGSVAEAERFLDSRHISDVLKGKRNHVKGWKFRYAEGGDA